MGVMLRTLEVVVGLRDDRATPRQSQQVQKIALAAIIDQAHNSS
jgi:hypothetical protein